MSEPIFIKDMPIQLVDVVRDREEHIRKLHGIVAKQAEIIMGLVERASEQPEAVKSRRAL